MGPHSERRDTELVCDLLRPLTSGKEPQHFDLTRRQLARRAIGIGGLALREEDRSGRVRVMQEAFDRLVGSTPAANRSR